ncbi:glycosyltransferase [Acidisoma sp. C75]
MSEEIEARYFDAAFYLDTYADIRAAGVDPFHHYRHWGAYEGRDPNAFFSTSWYLLQNPDVLEAGLNPLLHFVLFGAQEGRNPHPHFDVNFYVNQVPEAADDPLLYHLRHGRQQGLPTERQFRIEDAMPALGGPLGLPEGLAVDVILPVYRGFAETRRCLASLLRDRRPGLGGPLHRITVIDDFSPEPALSRYLDRLAARRFIHLIRHPRNLGFVASINRGIEEAGARDVVLLNADTEVPAGWLSRLAGHAYAGPRIASVSPFSNDATLCSYPSLKGGPLPFGESLERLDAAARAANNGRSVPVPVTVGFCLYLRRAALTEVGLFDAVAFGRGYGEESDFCMRASRAGWHHRLACDLFVYHKGEVSFGQDAPERAAHEALLDRRWPEYRQRVGLHVRLDEARPYRIATTLQLFATNGLPTLLMIQHAHEGGVGQYVQGLAGDAAGIANILALRSTMDGRGVRLTVPSAPDHPDFFIPFPEVAEREKETGRLRDRDEMETEGRALLLADLLRLLAPLRIVRVHVQHWVGLKLDLRALIHALDLPFDVTLHDWFALCPRINLLPVPDGPYCGEPAPAICDRCIQAGEETAALDILGWRAEHAWLFRLADRVLCATEDSIARLARYGLAARAVLAPLEVMPESLLPGVPARPPLSGSGRRTGPEIGPGMTTGIGADSGGQGPRAAPLRVAVLGVLAAHKGASRVAELAERMGPRRIAITLIGRAERPLPQAARAAFSETGAYEPDDLPALIEAADPEVIWFPATWPETWSYTLTQAIRAGRPILAPDLGAFPHRLAAYPAARLIPAEAGAEAVMAALLALARPPGGEAPRRAAARRGPAKAALPPSAAPVPAREQPAAFYPDRYYAPLRRAAGGRQAAARITDLRAPGRIAVVLIPERLEFGLMSACAYIRGLLPLTHPEIAGDVELTLATGEEALRLRPDLFVLHRHAVAEEGAAGALLAHAAAIGAPVIYDLDDDLVEIPADHAEAERLRGRRAAVLRLLAGASAVHASTPVLADRLAPFVRGGRGRIRIVPNGLDERLWLAGADGPSGLASALAVAGVAARPLRLLYMGTATHAADLALILPALRRLHESFGDRIAIDLVGVQPPGALPPFLNRVEVPRTAGRSYPAFVAWLTDRQRAAPWSIGLAPLVDTPFNRCKSPIKLLDYAALGLATVASRRAPYEAPVLGAGAWLAEGEGAWAQALSRLIRYPAERQALAEAGRAALGAHGLLGAQAAQHRTLLTGLLADGRGTAAPASAPRRARLPA